MTTLVNDIRGHHSKLFCFDKCLNNSSRFTHVKVKVHSTVNGRLQIAGGASYEHFQSEQQKHIHSDISVNCKYTCMYFGFLFFHLFHFAIPASHSFLYFPCLFPLVFCNTTSNRTTPHPSIYTPPLLFVRLLDCFVFFPCSSYTVCLLISFDSSSAVFLLSTRLYRLSSRLTFLIVL